MKNLFLRLASSSQTSSFQKLVGSSLLARLVTGSRVGMLSQLLATDTILPGLAWYGRYASVIQTTLFLLLLASIQGVVTNLRAPSTMRVTEDWPKLVHQSTWRGSAGRKSYYGNYSELHLPERHLDDAQQRWGDRTSAPLRDDRSGSMCTKTQTLSASEHRLLSSWKSESENLWWEMLLVCHLFRINSASLATLTMWSFMAWERRRPWKGIFQSNQLLHSIKTDFKRCFKRYCRDWRDWKILALIGQKETTTADTSKKTLEWTLSSKNCCSV